MSFSLPYALPSFLPGPVVDPTNEADGTGGSAGTLREVEGGLCPEGQDLLLAQYQDSPRLKALLCALLDPAQEFDVAAVGMYERALSLDDAEGVNLDLIGKIVREARDGRSDYVYRRALRVRVLINRSQGRLRDLIQIVRLFEDMDLPGSDPLAYVRIRSVQPKRLEVRIVSVPVNEAREIHKRLRQAKVAGDALTTMVLPSPDGTIARAFRFGRAADYPEKNTDQGFTSVLGPPPDGGYLLHALTGAV